MSPASCKSHCNVENDSSSIKTMQSGIEKESSNLSTFDQFSGIDVVCLVVGTLSGNQDQGSSDNSESKHGCLNKKGESSKPDVYSFSPSLNNIVFFSSLKKKKNIHISNSHIFSYFKIYYLKHGTKHILCIINALNTCFHNTF